MLSVDFVTKPQSASMFDMFGFFLDLLTVAYLYKVSEKFYPCILFTRNKN